MTSGHPVTRCAWHLGGYRRFPIVRSSASESGPGWAHARHRLAPPGTAKVLARDELGGHEGAGVAGWMQGGKGRGSGALEKIYDRTGVRGAARRGPSRIAEVTDLLLWNTFSNIENENLTNNVFVASIYF